MNPELLKQVFLIETKSNLILTIGFLFGLTWFIDQHLYALGLKTFCLFGFTIFCVISGSRKIILSVESEVKSSVWDPQRLSQVSPLTLLIGKTLGPAMHSWIIGLVCLGIYFWQGKNAEDTIEIMFLALLSALFFHTLALTYALLSAQQNRLRKKQTSLIFFFLLTPFVLPQINEILYPVLSQINDLLDQPVWYGREYDKFTFLIMSLLGMNIFTTIGAYRVLCMELKIRTTPSAWAFFILACGIYTSGFFTGDIYKDAFRNVLSCSCLIACLLSYLTGVIFQFDVRNYLHLKNAMLRTSWRRFVEESPLWLTSITIAIALGIVNATIGTDPIFKNEIITNLGLASLAIALIALRDLLILNYLRIRLQKKSSEFYFILMLGLLNVLLPFSGVFPGGSDFIFSNIVAIITVNLVFIFVFTILNAQTYARISSTFTQKAVQKS